VKHPPTNDDRWGSVGEGNGTAEEAAVLVIEVLKTFSLPFACCCSRVRWCIEMRDGELEGAVVGKNGK